MERDEALPIIVALHRGLLPQRVGALDRNEAWWTVRWHDPEAWRQGASAYRFALHYTAPGKPDGYAVFRVKEHGRTPVPRRRSSR